MSDSQVSQYRREQEQAERYYSADDLDACFEPDEEDDEVCPHGIGFDEECEDCDEENEQ